MNIVYQYREVSLTSDLRSDLEEITAGYASKKIFLIFESNTWKFCWPLINGFRQVPESNILVLKPGEDNKTMDQVVAAWEHLGDNGADRSSLVINVGGGMLTDLAGFAASTFKRGLSFINIPTTLLAMVDASAGGKTGVNFRGLKNEIGVIRQPAQVLLFLRFLETLNRMNLLSGYAEMLKAGLIADRLLWQDLRNFTFDDYSEEKLARFIQRSVSIKIDIVEADPEEHGIRKSLNFGHTIGHALESESLRSGKPLPHGYAVAFGMIAEAELSAIKLGLSKDSITEIRETITRLYGNPPETIHHADVLLGWMKFDKKNSNNLINFTLLEEIGKCRIDIVATAEEIRSSLIRVNG